MTTERPWLANYPAGIPAEIDVEEFRSVAAVFDEFAAAFQFPYYFGRNKDAFDECMRDLDEFVGAYRDREGVDSDRWKAFSYEEIVARDKANLDITWLRDESLEDLDNLPSPEVLAREIVEDLTAALSEFEAVAAALESQLEKPGPAV